MGSPRFAISSVRTEKPSNSLATSSQIHREHRKVELRILQRCPYDSTLAGRCWRAHSQASNNHGSEDPPQAAITVKPLHNGEAEQP